MPTAPILRDLLAGLREQEKNITRLIGELDVERDRKVQERAAVRDEIRDLQAYINRAGAAA